MKTTITHLLAATLVIGFVAACAGGETSPDLSSPQASLQTLLKASRDGSVPNYLACLSEKAKECLLKGVESTGDDIKDLIKPDDAYETSVSVGSTSSVTRAVLQMKVKYKSAWLEGQGMDVPSLSATELEELRNPATHSFNMVWNMPCAVQGTGYVAYVFTKEGESWKLVKGLGYPIPLDIKAFGEE